MPTLSTGKKKKDPENSLPRVGLKIALKLGK
jgi:hypothetical protein